MKKALLLTLAAISFTISSPSARAQTESDDSEFTLEEITITAEKREADIQKVPASVDVLSGDDLMEAGKLGTGNILANIPNVRGSGNNVVIRGIEMHSNDEGRAPSASASYVDGVFSGMGGSYDLERVEVLRGPQGTLYGRSALGGVTSYVTRNPMLDGFSATVNTEAGTADLGNIQAVVNAPIGDMFAVRAAGHYSERDGYINEEAGHSETKEGRIKILYQPSDALDIVATAQISKSKTNTGGGSVILEAPDGPFDYSNIYSVEAGEGAWIPVTQYSLNANYDFSNSKLTYIGGWRASDYGVTEKGQMNTIINLNDRTVDDTWHTEEIRLASDSEGPLQWLVGASYYNNKYEQWNLSTQMEVYTDNTLSELIDDPNTQNVEIFAMLTSGKITNYGIFTEETYELRDDLRITAGLRYDKTKVAGTAGMEFNNNQIAMIAYKPADIASYTFTDIPTYHNITYKLRFEYDLTPENMIYALTSTGFMPGDIKVTMNPMTSPPEFTSLPLDEEKMISYEVGSKNRFLDDKVQVNASAFYYDYEGFRYLVNMGTGQAPLWVPVLVPLKMYGAELDAKWMLTMKDKVTFTAGYIYKKITEYPEIDGVSYKETMMYSKVPGYPPFTANLGYDHTFGLPNGSMLVARADMNYTQGYILGQLTKTQYEAREWNETKSYALGNINATWSSPQGMFSATGYVRNLFDKEYKAGVSIPTNGDTSDYGDVTVTPGSPRVWGLIFSAKF